MKVGELLGGAYRTIVRRPKELLIWSVIQIILGVLVVSAAIPFITSATEAQRQALESGPQALPGVPAGIGLFFLAYLLILVWLLMLFTASVRMTASSGEDKFLWLRFGGDELRLIGLIALYMVASVALWLVVALVFGLVFGIATAASPTIGGILAVILAIACFCGAIWLYVRISLIGAVVVLERTFAIRKGWQATKGHFWTLLGTYLVLFLAYFVLEIVILAIMSPALLGTMFGGTSDPQQLIERQQQIMAMFSSPPPGLIILWLVGTVLATAGMVYYYSLVATAAIAATGYSRQDLADLESHFE
jgi:hypothetical protein